MHRSLLFYKKISDAARILAMDKFILINFGGTEQFWLKIVYYFLNYRKKLNVHIGRKRSSVMCVLSLRIGEDTFSEANLVIYVFVLNTF